MSIGSNINYAGGLNASTAGSNSQVMFIGVVALAIIILFFYLRNQQSLWVSFDNLTPQMQAVLNSYLSVAATIQNNVPPMTLGGQSIQTSIQHAIVNNIKCGVVITTVANGSIPAKSIYITYYECLNWLLNISLYPTLSVPERTIVNNAMSDSTTVGYSISTSVSGMSILALTQQTTPSISYSNPSGGTQTISTTNAPTLTVTPSTGNGATQTAEWTTFSSLSLPMQSIITGYMNIMSAMDVLPHVALNGNSYRITIQHITINGIQYGITVLTDAKSFYLTYCEFLNWTINAPKCPTLSIPDRSIVNNAITNGTTGFGMAISAAGIVLTQINQQTTPSISYTDALGASQTVSTTVLQSLS
jgi:hypothetical protein